MSDVPPRVRVTAPPRRDPVVPRARAGDASAGPEGEEAGATSRLEAVYLASLMRTQLWLALRVLATLGLVLGSVPLLFFAAPGLAAVDVAGLPLAWLVLGGAVYPLLVLLAWVYVRRAEHHERVFTELLGGDEG